MRPNKDSTGGIIDDEQKKFIEESFGAGIIDPRESFGAGIIDPRESFGAGIIDPRESTGAGTAIKPISNEGIGFEPEKLYVRYMEFSKYRIGLIEKENHEVIGIQSVEEIKKLYSDEQLSMRFNYWDVEKYYKKE